MDTQENRLPAIIKDACEKTGTSKEGILHLLDYYTEKCGWSKNKAVEHVLNLFETGIIEEIKALGREKRS